MKNNEIFRYIHNWYGLLDRKAVNDYLMALFSELDYFDFSVISYLHADGESVHIYPGISDDYKTLKLFVIAARFDRAEFRDELDRYVYVSTPKQVPPVTANINHEIDEDEAQKRIRRWNEAFTDTALHSAISHTLKVKCFIVPIEDIQTERSRAFFAFKEIAPGKYAFDLIIKKLHWDQSADDFKESGGSYDTIRLVPPFPPEGEEATYELLFH